MDLTSFFANKQTSTKPVRFVLNGALRYRRTIFRATSDDLMGVNSQSLWALVANEREQGLFIFA